MPRAVAVLCAVQLVDVLGVTLTTTALPSILADFDAGEAAATPVVTAYAAAFGGLLLLGARLGDRVGHRRLLLASLAAYAVASAVGALAPDVAVVVVSRALQGAAAALSVPAALRLLLLSAPEGGPRRRALAGWSAAGAAAGALGFLAGGVLTDAAGWRSGMWLSAVASAVLVPLVARTARATARDAARVPLDVVDGVLLTAGTMALVLGGALTEDAATRGLGLLLLAAGALVVAAFALHQRCTAHPLLPPGAFRNRRLRDGVAASALVTGTSSPALTLVALELQQARGFSASATGMLLLPASVAVVGGAAIAGRALDGRSRRSVAVAGLAALALGAATLAALGAVVAAVLVAGVLVGTGIGLASVAANAGGTDVPAELAGTASGALNTAAQLGTALGTAAVLTLAAATASRPAGWAAVAALGVAGVLGAVVSRPRRAGAPIPAR